VHSKTDGYLADCTNATKVRTFKTDVLGKGGNEAGDGSVIHECLWKNPEDCA